MNNTIQFLGLMLVMMTSKGITVSIPDVSSDNHVAFIAFEPDAAVASPNWPVSQFEAAKGNKIWSYVLLQNDTVDIRNGEGSKPAVPVGLPHLQYDCCPGMTLNTSPKLAAKVTIPNGTAGCTIDNMRVDTTLVVPSSAPIVIVAQRKDDVRTLTFKNAATIVFGNIPISYIDGTATTEEGEHFLAYYHKLGGNNAQQCKKTPKDQSCAPRQVCDNAVTLPITLPAIVKGAAIECSNSTWP